MAQVDDLATRGLQNAAHDVDGGIMPIEQTGSGNEADFMFRLVSRWIFHGGMIRYGQAVLFTNNFDQKQNLLILQSKKYQQWYLAEFDLEFTVQRYGYWRG